MGFIVLLRMLSQASVYATASWDASGRCPSLSLPSTTPWRGEYTRQPCTQALDQAKTSHSRLTCTRMTEASIGQLRIQGGRHEGHTRESE